MKTLELKDIVGYLPYGLKLLYPFKGSNRICDIEQMKKLCVRGGIGFVAVERWENGAINELHPYLYEIKPILRPLSDLYKPIIHNGKEIIPIVECAKIAGFKDCTEVLKPNRIGEYIVLSEEGHFGFAYLSKDYAFAAKCGLFHKETVKNQAQLFDFFHELKIDYRGLIDAGLAVSVSDLENNPYK
jgi:hypothetical protein